LRDYKRTLREILSTYTENASGPENERRKIEPCTTIMENVGPKLEGYINAGSDK